jgi:Rrf2 family protein
MANLLPMSEAAALALHASVLLVNRSRPLSTAVIADELCASEAHVSKVLQQLVRSGFLTSRRGPQGGYDFARPPHEISLRHVYEVFEGPMRTDGCLFDRPICGRLECILGTLVADVRRRVVDHFSSTTLDKAQQS